MISTYLLYRTYAADLPKTLSRISAQSDVSNAAKYYQANIDKVKTVDEFLNNPRLFSYAMTSYGLSDMTYAKAFMKKVLTSDLTDSKSFVNKLTDTRFLEFAKAFQFSTDGTLATQPTLAQNSKEESDTIGLYTQQQVNKGIAASTEATYYQAAIGNITSVDQLMANPRLLNFAVTAYGLNANITSAATIRAVLTSDLSDPNSAANTLGSSNSNYQLLAAAFNFATDGSVNGTAQSNDKIINTVSQYFNATGSSATSSAATFKTQYYNSAISSVTSVDDFLANSTLFDVAMTSVGLNPNTQSKTLLRQILTSDLDDPGSVANQQTNAVFKKLAAMFSFNTDGSVKDGAAQTSAQVSSLLASYSANYNAAQTASNNTATAAYKDAVAGISSVQDLLNSSAYNYILSAYGLDPLKTTKYTITKILQSDPSDPNSFANQSHNPAYIAMASAFNFDSNGKAKTAAVAQTDSNLTATVKLYMAQSGTSTTALDQAEADSNYYATTIATINNVDDLLKDTKLVNFMLSAYGLKDAKLSTSDLRTILTSDPLDPKSYINKTVNSKYRPLAVAFNFGTDGKTLTVPAGEAQYRSQMIATTDGYLQQTMETQAGDQSDGVRLALYFQRKASGITSPYQILADKALVQFAQTALGLSSMMSAADIDTQAKMITKRLDLADLQDPAKLNKLIAKFAALYDAQNADTSQSAVLQILQGNSSSNGIITINPITT
ncbi:DUF1217 domain-containing protein [Hyphomicrobium facile]|uniref:DUF1217 domain-containing protein n=1 Tax=Hyphomicrobium facile TaxID=51670 RepID=A0A1I7MZU1_9HYPH|nr:DUF1217 domain-containing protein [Hyphomicrobium facile]SFV27950.1 Protein of unknown function [Hyphomicrobium facile]